ncbi:AI-2E family transporter [Patescibacteria group bacterium]|nr:AI-2E family transporter [Patescibacteria group bacterium]
MKKYIYSDHAVSISPFTIIFTVFFLLSLYALYQMRSVMILLVLAFIIMVALNPMVKFLTHKLKLPKGVSIFLSYLTLIGWVSLIVGLLVPPLAKEVFQLINLIDLPVFQEEIRNFTFTLQEISAVIKSFSGSFGAIFSIINSTFTGVITVFTLIVMSFYLMMERQVLHKKVYWFTSKPEYVEKIKDFISSIEEQLGGWVRAQTILMFSIFAITYISLSLISIPYALPLALLAGLLEIIPNLGPTIAMVPAVFVTYLTFGPVMAGIVFLLYIIIQQIENNVLVPRVMQTSANVNPLVAITVILGGFQLGGIMGALLSIPIYIMARTFYSSFVRTKI